MSTLSEMYQSEYRRISRCRNISVFMLYLDRLTLFFCGNNGFNKINIDDEIIFMVLYSMYNVRRRTIGVWLCNHMRNFC